LAATKEGFFEIRVVNIVTVVEVIWERRDKTAVLSSEERGEVDVRSVVVVLMLFDKVVPACWILHNNEKGRAKGGEEEDIRKRLTE
jgi:hypothetical protein